MKKNRIIAGLSAIMMGATMMASTAMSASAKTVYDTLGGSPVIVYTSDGSNYATVSDANIYTYYDTDKDGIKEWALAPRGMADGLFDSVTYDSTTGDYTIVTKTYTYMGISGYITSCTLDGTTTDLFDSSNNTITVNRDDLTNGCDGYVSVDLTLGGSLASLIGLGLVPMSNPVTDCRIVFE